MVNVMCQLDWAMEPPDIWPNIILGVLVRVFLDEWVQGIEQIALLNMGGTHPMT